MKLRRLSLFLLPFVVLGLDAACSSDDSTPNGGTRGGIDASPGTPTDSGNQGQGDSSSPGTDSGQDASSPVTDAGNDAAKPLKLDCNTSGETKSGTYDLDPDGAGPLGPMQLYCDQTWDGGGWTLIEAYNAINSGPSGLPDASGAVVGPKPGVSAYLPADVMIAIVTRAKQVHIRYSFEADGGAPDSGTAKWITSKSEGYAGIFRENLLLRKLINRGVDAGTIQSFFEGPSATAATLGFNDNDSACTKDLLNDAGYPAIYHACGNFSGLHIVNGMAKFNYASATNDPVEIYVR